MRRTDLYAKVGFWVVCACLVTALVHISDLSFSSIAAFLFKITPV